MAEANDTAYFQECVNRLAAGDAGARDRLVAAACGRLELLTHKMLARYPGVKRWEQTADVLQNALLRLNRALTEVAPRSVREFFGLAALQIRRELLDLARHHLGPQGAGAHHASNLRRAPDGGSSSGANPAEPADPGESAEQIELWTAFHRAAGELPDEQRAVFELLWYQGLSHEQAAELLGVSTKSVQRRWLSARVALHDALRGRMPE